MEVPALEADEIRRSGWIADLPPEPLEASTRSQPKRVDFALAGPPEQQWHIGPAAEHAFTGAAAAIGFGTARDDEVCAQADGERDFSKWERVPAIEAYGTSTVGEAHVVRSSNTHAHRYPWRNGRSHGQVVQSSLGVAGGRVRRCLQREERGLRRKSRTGASGARMC